MAPTSSPTFFCRTSGLLLDFRVAGSLQCAIGGRVIDNMLACTKLSQKHNETSSFSGHVNPLNAPGRWLHCLAKTACDCIRSSPNGHQYSKNSESTWGSAFLTSSSGCDMATVENLQDESQSQAETINFRKKKVALWVGYVGTDYRGLQIVRGPDAVNTIEDELERAIFKAGGILQSNYGELQKISWSRSSRTDKGVHSLATVISMKMEVPPTTWIADLDGILLAERINFHLPPSIQVFGVVPVTKSFNARRFCCNRTYHYLLPAKVIGIEEETTEKDISHIIEKFRIILQMFEGRYPFHNYTIRRLYRKHVTKENIDNQAGQYSRSKSDVPIVESLLSEDNDLDEEPAASNTHVEAESSTSVNGLKARWLHAPVAEDKVFAAHFRKVLECSCGGLESSCGMRFIRISITGESFMAHQIRKIVATAVGVLRDVLPSDIIPMSLCRHSRVVLPLAPSEGLVLAKNSFYPYRQLLAPASERAFRDSDVGLSRLGELPKLKISTQISSRVDTFWRDVLLPEISPLLDVSRSTWSMWIENLDSQGGIPTSETDELRARWLHWRESYRQKSEDVADGPHPASNSSSTFPTTWHQ